MKFHSITALTTCLILAFGLTACTTNTKPRFQSSNEIDEPIQFKRYTKRPAVDYLFRFDKQAFKQVQNDEFDIMSDDKRDVVLRHGRPDYFRENIRARRNESFDEWVFWDENIICQFVSGELVYEDELMDSDRALVEWGYPSSVDFQEYEIGPVRETWTWYDEIKLGTRTMSFSDGKTVFKANQ